MVAGRDTEEEGDGGTHREKRGRRAAEKERKALAPGAAHPEGDATPASARLSKPSRRAAQISPPWCSPPAQAFAKPLRDHTPSPRAEPGFVSRTRRRCRQCSELPWGEYKFPFYRLRN